MNCLVTGGAGFIGSNLVRQLLRDGHTVSVLDNFSSGKLSNLADISDWVTVTNGDIRDFWSVQKVVTDIDIIFHQAALPSVPRSVANPLTSNEVNVSGTLNVLESARLAGVRRIVMASSSSVYGDTEELPKHEGMPTRPLSPYAVSKLTDEMYARVYYELYGLETVCLRYFNIFGPYQDPDSFYSAVIPKFIAALSRGESPTVYGDGEQSRDFTYIDNCVAANLVAAQTGSAAGNVYNVACGAHFTLNELLLRLGELMGVPVQAKYVGVRHGDIKHSYASVDRLAAHGYQPVVGFEEGLLRTIEFFDSRTIRAEAVSTASM